MMTKIMTECSMPGLKLMGSPLFYRDLHEITAGLRLFKSHHASLL